MSLWMKIDNHMINLSTITNINFQKDKIIIDFLYAGSLSIHNPKNLEILTLSEISNYKIEDEFKKYYPQQL